MDSYNAFLPELRTSALVSILLLCLALLVRRIYFGPLKAVPGPLRARLTNFWMVKQTLDGAQHRVWERLHQEYGPVVRIGPDTILVSDYQDFRKVFSPGTKFQKAVEYEAFDLLPGVPHIFSVRDQQTHSKMRKRVANAYSSATMVGLEKRIDKKLEMLVNKMRELADSKNAFDISQWISFYTFDVLGMVGFNQSFGYLEHGRDLDGIIKAVQTTTPLLIAFSHVAWLVKVIRSRLIRALIGSPAGIAKLDKLVRRIIRERIQKPIQSFECRDMLDHFVNGTGMSEDATFVETELIFFAGADTIAASIKAALFCIMQHEVTYLKLKQEIRDLREAGKLSNPPRYAETTQMPYLLAVLRESRRLFPAASAKFMRCTPSGGATLGGHFIPEGTNVGCNAWVLHRNESCFGKDASTFRPERWLGGSQTTEMMTKSDFSFGMGARECAGKHLALIEVQKSVLELVDKFQFTFEDPQTPWFEQNYGVVFQKNMWVRDAGKV